MRLRIWGARLEPAVILKTLLGQRQYKQFKSVSLKSIVYIYSLVMDSWLWVLRMSLDLTAAANEPSRWGRHWWPREKRMTTTMLRKCVSYLFVTKCLFLCIYSNFDVSVVKCSDSNYNTNNKYFIFTSSTFIKI